jgi:hypothetical protein
MTLFDLAPGLEIGAARPQTVLHVRVMKQVERAPARLLLSTLRSEPPLQALLVLPIAGATRRLRWA